MAVFDILDKEIVTAYSLIEWNGVPLPRQTTLNLVATNSITVTDNPGNSSTDVTFAPNLEALAAFNTNGILVYTGSNTFTGRTITGTAGFITVTNGSGVAGNPTITIDATYAGQTSINTVGTITNGTWHGNLLTGTYGGTGVNNGSNTITLGGSISTAGALTLSGAFAATFTFTNTTSVTFPTSGTLATTSQLPTLPLSLANGGTNASLTASNGGIFYSTASAGAILAGTATANQVLLSGASTAPAWSTATYPATVTQGDLLYASAANTISSLAKNITATRYLANTGTSNAPNWDQVNMANGVTGTLQAAQFPALTGDVTTSAGSLATTIAYNAVTYAKFQQVAASSLVGNPTGSLANAQGITLGATLTFVSTALQTVAMTGDVTTSANSFATTIAANAVTYAKFQQVAASSLVGNATGSLANATGITLGATLTFSGSALQTVAHTGDVTTSANSFVTTIAAGAVTNAKMANMANNTVKGNNSGISAAPSDITASNVLDMIGSTQGDILYRDSGGWQVLAPGTSGNFLQTQGSSANPVWASAGNSNNVTYGVSYPVARQLFLM